MRLAWWTPAVLGGLLAFSSPAAADDASLDALRAGRLFHEGEELFDAHRFAEACPKFAQSYALEPQLGTLLNLAFCHESEGRTATALSEFDAGLRWALSRTQKDREAFAREHIARLEKVLSFLVVERGDEVLEGLEVRVDGRPVGSDRLGIPQAVDPGLHTLLASAPGKDSQPLVFFVEPGPSTRRVRVPSLLAAVPVAGSTGGSLLGTPAKARPEDTIPKTVALVSFGVGTTALVVATTCAIRAASAAGHAAGNNDPAAAGTARDFSIAAAVSAGVALAGFGTGTWLVLSQASRGSSTEARLDVSPFGATVSGRF